MNIKFCSLSSGSSGNCQYIETNKTRILIDSGFSGKKIESLLKSIDVEPRSIDAILVTHEHIDHVRGVGILSRRYGIPVYANENTWKAMTPTIKEVKTENSKLFDSNKIFQLNDLDILPFTISHDSIEPVGYIIFYKNKKISIITDTGWVNDNTKNLLKDSDLYFLESNHDVRMLRGGMYPWNLKKRIMSRKGHLSNDDAGMILGDLLSGFGETVLLAHLSQDNNRPDIAYNTVRNIITSRGLDADKDINLGMTFRDRTTCIYTL